MRVRPFFWVLLVVACLGSLTLAAIVQVLPPVRRPDVPTVLMGPTNFLQRSITLEKGQRLTLLQEASDEHIITNGSWVDSTQRPSKEPGAPTVDVTVSGVGSSAMLGPFNTAGTFHLYCPLHLGMDLTVQVI
jgi:hypothetical protein